MDGRRKAGIWSLVLALALLGQFLPVRQVCAGEQGSKPPFNFFEDIFGMGKPRIKYSPAEGPVLPYEAVPDWLKSWRDFKKEMEEKYGTSIGVVLDDHHQHILSGPGIIHQDYRRANNATHTETVLEACYKIHISDWCSMFKRYSTRAQILAKIRF
jgi:hypothetical protein